MLWDLIRDFFVMHVFGGVTSNGNNYQTFLGGCNYGEYGDYLNCTLNETYLNFSFWSGDADVHVDRLSFADWLSTTATMISITIIVVLCCLFIYKIIKLIGGLIR